MDLGEVPNVGRTRKVSMTISYGLSFKLPVLEKSRATERGSLIEEMTNAINLERVGTKYKPMTLRAVAVKIGHIETKDLYYLLSICNDSKNRCGSFSKCFFGSLKSR